MIQGVHAETIVFALYERARDFVLTRNLPTVGIPSQFGGREVELGGSQPRPFQVRLGEVRERSKTISCLIELHDVARLHSPLIRAEISFVPDGLNTRVTLRGSAARTFTPAASAHAATALRLANEYARAFLEQLAHAIESRPSPGSIPDTQQRAVEAQPRKRG